MKRTLPYSATIRQKAIAAYVAGKSSSEIAKDLGCGQSTVREWVAAAGIKRRPARRPPGATPDEIIALYRTGMCAEAIRRKLRVGTTTIAKVLCEAGVIKTPRILKPVTDAERKKWAEMYKSGMTLYAIGRKCSKNERTISRELGSLVKRKAPPRPPGSVWNEELHQRQEAEKEAYRRLMASIPEDTRPLSARLCGDPLPGRSALDRMMGR